MWLLNMSESLLRHFRAKRCFLERIRYAPDRGTQGKIIWTRDELHRR